jgi:hypothetical protein
MTNHRPYFQHRRKLLKSMLLISGLPLYGSFGWAKALSHVPKAELTLADFSNYTKKILRISQLDTLMLKHIYQLIHDEPWGLSHLQRIANKLTHAQYNNNLTLLDQSEHWFLGHFITTWVTGVYYHERGDVMVSYQHALMYEALKDIRPVPGFSAAKFGFWSKPPTHTGIVI